MKKLGFLLMSTFFIASCSDYAKFKKSGKRMYLNVENLEIDKVKEVQWRVGIPARQKISRGLKVAIKLPKLKKEDLHTLVNNSGVDSWLLKIYRKSFGGKNSIGYMSIPLVNPGHKKGSSFRLTQIKMGYFQIFYSASAVSTRLSRLPCPAFNHRYVVGEPDIVSSHKPSSTLIIGGGDNSFVSAKVTKFSYTPYIINAGESIRGVYTVEASLYNSVTERRLSNSYIIPQEIVVNSEREKKITGCQNYKLRYRKEDEGDRIKKFNFGKKKK